MNDPTPGPRPEQAGLDLDELRTAFGDLLEESVGAPGSVARGVSDDQVVALSRAHTLLSDALEGMEQAR